MNCPKCGQELRIISSGIFCDNCGPLEFGMDVRAKIEKAEAQVATIKAETLDRLEAELAAKKAECDLCHDSHFQALATAEVRIKKELEPHMKQEIEQRNADYAVSYCEQVRPQVEAQVRADILSKLPSKIITEAFPSAYIDAYNEAIAEVKFLIEGDL